MSLFLFESGDLRKETILGHLSLSLPQSQYQGIRSRKTLCSWFEETSSGVYWKQQCCFFRVFPGIKFLLHNSLHLTFFLIIINKLEN